MSRGLGEARPDPPTMAEPRGGPTAGLRASAKRLLDDLRCDWMLYVLLMPMVLWFAAFLYKPMYGLQIAFKDYSLWKGAAASPWVGLEHFRTLFADAFFLRSIKNTFLIALYSLLFAFPVPIVLALMFNEVRRAFVRSSVQTLAYLPHFISSVIVAGIVINLFAPSTGIVNAGLEQLGFERIYFLTQPEYFRPIFIGSTIWKEAGFESIVYLAAIAGISPTLYESAQVDGASRWQMMWRVTLPSILPTVLVMLIIRIGNLVEVGFEYVILLYQPSTYDTADVISTFIYRSGIQGSQYDLGAAAGLFNGLVAFALVYVANLTSRRLSSTSLW